MAYVFVARMYTHTSVVSIIPTSQLVWTVHLLIMMIGCIHIYFLMYILLEVPVSMSYKWIWKNVAKKTNKQTKKPMSC